MSDVIMFRPMIHDNTAPCRAVTWLDPLVDKEETTTREKHMCMSELGGGGSSRSRYDDPIPAHYPVRQVRHWVLIMLVAGVVEGSSRAL